MDFWIDLCDLSVFCSYWASLCLYLWWWWWWWNTHVSIESDYQDLWCHHHHEHCRSCLCIVSRPHVHLCVCEFLSAPPAGSDVGSCMTNQTRSDRFPIVFASRYEGAPTRESWTELSSDWWHVLVGGWKWRTVFKKRKKTLIQPCIIIFQSSTRYC